MYLPAHFAEHRPEVLQRLVRERPLGLLVTQSRGGGIAADPIPFVLDAEASDAADAADGAPATRFGVLRAHVARANPLWREARGDVDSLVVFQGPQAYVSPGWYASKAEHGKVVPTWNYIVVQGTGRLVAIDDAAWLRRFVGRLTDRHEAPRAAPWAMGDAPADYVETMLGAIVGIEIALASLVGKWKVSQNRPAADRDGVVEGLSTMSAGGALGDAVEIAGGAADAAAMAREVARAGRR